jgi:hypothetical protein
VTDVEVIPGAGQWLDEITLKRLARYVLNNYLIFGPGTWREREDREASFTVQEENDLSLLYHDGNLRILSFDIKKWSLDRRPRTYQSKAGGTSPSVQRQGQLDLQWLPLHMEHGPREGWGFLLDCTPLCHSLWKCPSCLHWYFVLGVGPCWVGNSLSAAIRS